MSEGDTPARSQKQADRAELSAGGLARIVHKVSHARSHGTAPHARASTNAGPGSEPTHDLLFARSASGR